MLRPIEATEAEQRTLARYRKRSSVISCEIVAVLFDEAWSFLRRIESDGVSIESTTVSVVFNGNGDFQFHGVASEYTDNGIGKVKASWDGKAKGDSESSATLALLSEDGETVSVLLWMQNRDRMFKLSRSYYSPNAYFCELRETEPVPID